MKKDSKYTFNINKEQKEKFKAYCKLVKMSPSDMLIEVIENFNNDVDKIVQMKDVSELQEMLQGKFQVANNEIELLKVKKN